MKNPIRIRYFFWLATLLLAFWLVNSLTLLAINLPSILDRGPDWREEFYEWVVITSVGGLLLPLLLYAAWRLSSRLLQPLRFIIKTSNRIYGGHLDERIQVEDTHDEISELAASLNRAWDRYQDVVRRHKQFTGMASHQLRTPLTTIRTAGEVALQDERSPEEYCDVIGRMLEEANRLSRIIEQLLLMAKLNRDELDKTFSDVDTDRLIQEVLERYQPLLQDKRIQVTRSGITGLTLQGQLELLSQALVNLVDNAVRHTPPDGTIEVTVSKLLSSQVEISVCDSGNGFFSLEAAQEMKIDSFATRSGLGLHIVREIVQAHNGSIHIGSSALGGASVCLRLPLFKG